MGDEQVGDAALLLQAAQQVEHLGADGHIQSRDGLVGNDELRLHDQGAGNADALALAAAPVFAGRIAVTRTAEVEALCRAGGVPVLRHAEPRRSDTVRLGLTALLAQLVPTGGKTALVCLHAPALALDSCDILVVLQGGGVAAVLRPNTAPPAVLQAALAGVYGPLELLPVTDCRGRRRLALLPL